MIEFIGAFLGALIGVCIPIGITMYKINESVKKSFKDAIALMSLQSTIQMDIKHAI